MMKKLTAVALIITLAIGCTACGDKDKADSANNPDTNANEVSTTVSSNNTSDEADENNKTSSDENTGGNTSQVSADEYFADGDFKDVTSEEPDATITLSGNTGTISDTTRGTSGSEVTITSKGIYRVSGSAEDVTITVNDDNESGNVYLVLDDVEMTNASSACIYVEASDKVIIQCVGDNKLTYTNSDNSIDGAIYAKDDITINGTGNLSISSAQHGIVCKNDLKLTGAELTIDAESIGIKAGDSVRVGGGTSDITSGHDGIQVANDSSDSYLYFKDGDMTINAGYDGIDVGDSADSDTDSYSGYISLVSGKLDITAGNGSDNSKNSSTSQKGVKCDGDINIADIELSVSSADDAVHGKADIKITSGKLALSTSDDGMSAYSTLSIAGGDITVVKSYEGLEGNYIEISGGNVSVTASDDGLNAAGGSDTSSDDFSPWGSTSTDASLTISGGNVYVNASGDGLDSNGSIYVTGGTVIVEGPTGNDNGALDKGDSSDCVASITGGVVLAIGSTGMAVNFDTGTQCSALVNLSGTSGTEIAVDDGSGFSYTATKDFSCAVYSSPDMSQGNSYTITAGSGSATMDFSSSLYYSDVSSMGGGMGNMGGGMGNRGGGMGPR